MRISACVVGAVAALAVAAGSAVAVPVYTNNFESGTVGSEWSMGTVSTTPGGTTPPTRFLGEFGPGAVNLTLNSLQPHTSLDVVVDLLLLRTWDGNGELGGGPDSFGILVDGTPVLDATFTNWPFQTQSYPAPRTSGLRNVAQTGALVANSMGFSFNGTALDAIYRLNFSVPHTGETAVIRFTSFQNEAIDNESWGVDNITVDAVGAVPIPLPSAIVMGPLGLLAAAWATRRLRAVV